MLDRLIKEAVIRLAHNYELKAPHMRTSVQPKATAPKIRAFGFSVPVRKTDSYYFGDPKFMPPGNYREIHADRSNRSTNGVLRASAPYNLSRTEKQPKSTSRKDTVLKELGRPIEYFNNHQ